MTRVRYEALLQLPNDPFHSRKLSAGESSAGILDTFHTFQICHKNVANH